MARESCSQPPINGFMSSDVALLRGAIGTHYWQVRASFSAVTSSLALPINGLCGGKLQGVASPEESAAMQPKIPKGTSKQRALQSRLEIPVVLRALVGDIAATCVPASQGTEDKTEAVLAEIAAIVSSWMEVGPSVDASAVGIELAVIVSSCMEVGPLVDALVALWVAVQEVALRMLVAALEHAWAVV